MISAKVEQALFTQQAQQLRKHELLHMNFVLSVWNCVVLTLLGVKFVLVALEFHKLQPFQVRVQDCHSPPHKNTRIHRE